MESLKSDSSQTSKNVKSVTYFFIIFYTATAFIINPIFFKNIISVNKQLSENVFNILLFIFLIIVLLVILLVYCLFLIKKEKMKIPTIINNINLLIIFTVFILIVLELVFRLFQPQEPLRLSSYNEYLDYHYLKPNQNVQLVTDEYDIVFYTNNIGLRSKVDFKENKHEEEIRIMNIGDSFVQAAQVNIEETMTFLFERKLNSMDTEYNYTVYNIGTSGFGTSQYREFIKRNTELFKPDYILLFLYVGNDIITIGDIPDVNPSPTIIKAHFESFIFNLSRISMLVNYFNIRLRAPEPEWMGPIGRPIQPFDTLPENISANIFLKDYNKYIDDAYEKVYDDLININEHCLKHRIQFHVFLIPTKEQVKEDKFKEVINILQMDRNRIDLYKPQKLLKIFFEKNNIQYYDLLEQLKEASEEKDTYYEIDSHWNVYGNYVVSEIVYDYFINEIKRNYIPYNGKNITK